jgi:hypothetical protein
MTTAMIGVLSAFVTGLLLLLGTRFVARQSREVGEQQVEVEQRKVDQEAFDRFVKRYELDRDRQDEELAETRGELRETRSLFRTALKHINQLRSELRRRDPHVPVPPLPVSLETVPWDLLGEGDSPT